MTNDNGSFTSDEVKRAANILIAACGDKVDPVQRAIEMEKASSVKVFSTAVRMEVERIVNSTKDAPPQPNRKS